MGESQKLERRRGGWKHHAGTFIMVVSGIVVGLTLHELWIVEPLEILPEQDRYIRDYLRHENEQRIKVMGDMIERVEQNLEAHNMAFEALKSGKMGFGTRGIIYQSYLQLDFRPTVPVSEPLSIHLLARLQLDQRSNLKLIRRIAELDREILRLKEREADYRLLVNDIQEHLFQLIGFGWTLSRDGTHKIPDLEYRFSELSNDRLLKNYYFKVLAWNEDWLERAAGLMKMMETIREELE